MDPVQPPHLQPVAPERPPRCEPEPGGPRAGAIAAQWHPALGPPQPPLFADP